MLKQELFWREHYHVLEKIRCSFFFRFIGWTSRPPWGRSAKASANKTKETNVEIFDDSPIHQLLLPQSSTLSEKYKTQHFGLLLEKSEKKQLQSDFEKERHHYKLESLPSFQSKLLANNTIEPVMSK